MADRVRRMSSKIDEVIKTKNVRERQREGLVERHGNVYRNESRRPVNLWKPRSTIVLAHLSVGAMILLLDSLSKPDCVLVLADNGLIGELTWTEFWIFGLIS